MFDNINKGFNIMEVDKKLPIFSTILANKDAINKDLISFISEYKKENPTSRQTNVKCDWRSPWKLHEDSRFKEFVDLLIDKCNFVCRYHLNRDSQFQCTSMWAMQYETGSHALPHDHFPSNISAVYYVDVEPDSSPIIFEDRVMFKPENGLLVLFPSILGHQVPPTHSKRMVISANLRAHIVNSDPNFLHS